MQATKPAPVNYRSALLSRRTELLSRLGNNSDATAAASRAKADEDVARAEHDAFVSLRIGSLAYQQLRLVDAALARLDAGEYGVCLECEEEISAKRLAAIPWANRCIECQERAGAEEAARAA